MTDEAAEAQAKAARHLIYKEGVCSAQHVKNGTITEDSLKAKGFVRDPETGDWQRPRKDAG